MNDHTLNLIVGSIVVALIVGIGVLIIAGIAGVVIAVRDHVKGFRK